METLTIKRAEVQDADLITEILNKGFYADFLRYGYKPPSYERPIEKTIALIEYGHTYIGYVNDVAVVTGAVYPAEKEGYYEVKALATIPSSQGKGFGKKMMEFLHKKTVKTNLFTLTTPVDKQENFKFYTSFGYKVVGEFLEEGNPIYIFEKED